VSRLEHTLHSLGFSVFFAVAGCAPVAESKISPVGAPDSTKTLSTVDVPRAASTVGKERGFLYVSSVNSVAVFTYPGGLFKGKLSGFGSPAGLCVDESGDLFVTDQIYNAIYEYPHGSAQPSAVLSDGPYSKPQDCSLDPTTGNLAVKNNADYDLGIGVYRHAKGKPSFYADPDFYQYFGCGYDSQGNLFTDGWNHSLEFVVAELPKGSSSFVAITLRKLPYTIYLSGGIKWDGKYVAIDDMDRSTIYQVKVRRSVGTVVGATVLTDGYSTGAFWFPGLRWGESGRQATQVVGTHAYSGIQYWNYPAGGHSTKTISIGDPFGVTVSPGHT
jgi:hypothetical protein